MRLYSKQVKSRRALETVSTESGCHLACRAGPCASERMPVCLAGIRVEVKESGNGNTCWLLLISNY